MKISYLLKTFPNQSETFILDEIEGLRKLGMEVEILALAPSTQEPPQGGVTYVPNPRQAATTLWNHLILFLSSPRRYAQAVRFCGKQQKGGRLRQFAQAGMVSRILRRKGVSHLHAHFANQPTAVAEIVRVFTGIPYSFTAHAQDIYYSDQCDLRRQIRSAQFVLTGSAFNRRCLREIADSRTPIQIASHGVDPSVFETQPRPAESDLPVIMGAGRFCEKRGFAYLIRACAVLKQQGRAFRCRIVGFGELGDNLATLIAELGVEDCVSLEGPMAQDQVAQVYRTASVFVLPSLFPDFADRNGIPNVVLEAMNLRVPVVSTNIAGISDVVEHMKDAILVPERDVESLADAMAILLDEPELRARLAANAHRKVLDSVGLESGARYVLEAFQNLRFTAVSEKPRRQVATAA